MRMSMGRALRGRTALLVGVSLWAGLAAAPPALAQAAGIQNTPADAQTDPRADAPPTAEADAEQISAADAETAQPADPNELEEIIVTAQRRSERLQDVPAAISAFRGEQLERSGVVNTRDLQQVTPSLAFTQASYAPQPAIRGIGTRGVNPGDEQVVPVYLDGVYQPFVVGGLFELSNVERIEVLRGPQGTLLGRNATGGAINIITEAPQPGFSGRAVVGYGSYNERSATAILTGGTEMLSASLDAAYLKDDGYVFDVTNNRDFGSIDSVSARLKVQFKPSDRTTITGTLSYYDRYDDTSLANFALNGNTIARQGRPTLAIETGGRRSSQDPGFSPRLTTDQTAASLTVVHRFDQFDVTSITGASRSTLSFAADADMAPVRVVRLDSDQYDESFTEDLFLSSTGEGRFQWVTGLFFFDNEAGQNPRNLNGGLIFTDTRARAYAIYAQGSYEITEALNLTLGGRYSYDTKSAFAFNGPVNTLVLPRTEKSWDSFNPSVSLDYAVNADTKVYARYATAFKSGVFNATGFARDPVEPEQVKTFEVGLKADPTPRIRTNVAIFSTDYSNIQIFARSPDPTNASVVLQNAASAKISGVEGDLILRPIAGLNVIVSASYLDAKYDEFPLAQSFANRPGGGNTAIIIDASGNRLVRVPEFTGSVSADYTVPAFGGSLTFAGNAYHNGGFSWGVDDRIVQEAYTLVNASVAFTLPGDRYTVTLWGRNLTDSDHLLTVSSSVLGDQAAYSRPRTVGVRLSAEF